MDLPFTFLAVINLKTGIAHELRSTQSGCLSILGV